MSTDAYYRAAQLANNGLLASLVLRALKPLLRAADAGVEVPALNRVDRQRVRALRDVLAASWRGSLPIVRALDERALPEAGIVPGSDVADDFEAFEIMRSVLGSEESGWLEQAIDVLKKLEDTGWEGLGEEQAFVRDELQPFLRRLAQPRPPIPASEVESLSA